MGREAGEVTVAVRGEGPAMAAVAKAGGGGVTTDQLSWAFWGGGGVT